MSSRIMAECTREGWVFKMDEKTVGPYWTANPPIVEIAGKLGVQPKALYDAILESYRRELSLDELAEILDSTVKKDFSSKLLVFLGMLLAQTEEDQINIALQAESSSGKSYIPLELIEYFPESERRIYAGASPTAFFHEVGEWDEERKVIKVDLEKKILVFLDQPHWQLLEKLRPLLSHDSKTLVYKITDKKERKGLLTKTVEIKGYPTVIFCTAKGTSEDQEKTRIWLLSPETNEEKILEALNLLSIRESDKQSFKRYIEEHPQRRWLKMRIEVIRRCGISEVVIPNSEMVLSRYLARPRRQGLQPRDLRDFAKLLRIIKAIALLNAPARPKADEKAIIATEADIEEAWRLYLTVAEANEFGIPPAHLEFYQRVVKPTALPAQGCTRRELIQAYQKTYLRRLSLKRLVWDLLPSLEAAGLIIQEPDPLDKRIMRVYATEATQEEEMRREGREEPLSPPDALQPQKKIFQG